MMAAGKAGGVPDERSAGGAAGGVKLPPHATPKAADVGNLPRQIDPLDRATKDTTRYKVRCDATDTRQPMHYILAAKDDQKSAEAFYRTLYKLPADVALVVVTLPD